MPKIYIFYIIFTILTYFILQWNCFSWNPIWNFIEYIKLKFNLNDQNQNQNIININTNVLKPNIECSKYPGCSFLFYTFTFLIFYFIISIFPSQSEKGTFFYKKLNWKYIFIFIIIFILILSLLFFFIQQLEQNKIQWIGFFLWLCCMFFYSLILLPFYLLFKIKYQLFNEITIINLLYFFMLSLFAFYFPNYIQKNYIWIPILIGIPIILIGRFICKNYFKIEMNTSFSIFSYISMFLFGIFIWYLISPYQENKNIYNQICYEISQGNYQYFVESFRFFQNIQGKIFKLDSPI